MAGLVESGLRNLDYGDADSVGFFQMRVGIWNKGDYAGYPDKAELQLKWFLDNAVAVKQQRIAGGQPVDDPGSYGEWIADVERPAEPVPRSLPAAPGGGARPAQGRSREPRRRRRRRRAGRRPGRRRRRLRGPASARGRGRGQDGARDALPVGRVLARRRASTAPASCSGPTRRSGIRIPRTSEQQILASNGQPVDRRHLIPGDLVFFRDSGGDVHHVGISLGGDKFINAPHTGDVVKVASLDEPYYAQQFAGGRRFDMAGGRTRPSGSPRQPAQVRDPRP